MSSMYIFVFFMIITLVTSDNSKVKNSRKSRFISFNSASEDIDVSLDFSVPFIKIPIRKNFNFDSGFGLGFPKINFNPSSLAFGGAMVLVTSILASFFSGKSYVPQHPYQNGQRYSRDYDGGFMTGELLEIASTVVSNGHSCPAKLACWASRHSDHERLEIWQQIIGNKLLSAIMNTTAVEYAFVAGRNGIDCDSFAPCPLTEEQFTRLGSFNL